MTTHAEPISIVRSSINTKAVALARELLARCESGEVVAFTLIERNAGNTYRIRHSSDYIRSHRTSEG